MDALVKLEVACQMLSQNNEKSMDTFEFKINGGGLDVVLHHKTSLLASLKMAFVFWQVDLPLDTIHVESEQQLQVFQVIPSSPPRVRLESIIKKTNTDSNEEIEPMDICFEASVEEGHVVEVVEGPNDSDLRRFIGSFIL